MTNDGYSYRIQLDASVAGLNLLDYLCREYAHSSKPEWQNRIERGEVLVNDRVANSEQQLLPGTILVWNRPGWEEPHAPCEFRVIYDDAYLVVVDKPSGLPTLPGGGYYQNTLLHLVQQQHPEARPMHRLGRGTSGLVVFAKNSKAAGQLGCNWKRVRKLYLAVSQGHASEGEYDIQKPIGMIPHPKLGHVHAACDNGKFAQSIARTLSCSKNLSRPKTLFHVELVTGRPHQIRIHLACIGHPLVKDPMYAAGGGLIANPGLPGDLGYFLHANSLELTHPNSGELLALHAEPPPGFNKVMGN